jgi:hypothetical protein
VTPISTSTRRAKLTSVSAAPAPLDGSQPLKSRKASSIDSGSTSGVKAIIRVRISRPTRAYFPMSGGSTTACGHKVRARDIGIAERTPNVRAM